MLLPAFIKAYFQNTGKPILNSLSLRNPYSRFRSLWKYKNEYKLELDSDGKIDIKKYIEYFGTENIVELQSNLKNSGLEVKYTDKSRFRPLQIYGNYLNENIDRIYHYESLPDMLEELGERFKINFPEQKEEKSSAKPPELSQESIGLINNICLNDFIKYGYGII